MKKANILTVTVLALAFLFGINLATALEPIPKESGFSGFIRPSVGYLNFKSNMVASFLGYDLSKESIDSLSDSPDSQSSGALLWRLSLWRIPLPAHGPSCSWERT